MRLSEFLRSLHRDREQAALRYSSLCSSCSPIELTGLYWVLISCGILQNRQRQLDLNTKLPHSSTEQSARNHDILYTESYLGLRIQHTKRMTKTPSSLSTPSFSATGVSVATRTYILARSQCVGRQADAPTSNGNVRAFAHGEVVEEEDYHGGIIVEVAADTTVYLF